MKRIAVRVPLERAEEARAAWLDRFPAGFEERELDGELELAAYADSVPEDLDGAEVADVEAGWEDRWRAFHEPVRIGPLWVGPPWEEPPRDAVAVVIDPGRAFGTGAHPTTRLCLEWLLELEPRSLLDVGCGSGVVAIAGAMLGCSPVVAYDVDPAAIEATRRNADVNAVTLDARLCDATAEALPEAAVAIANIAVDVVAAIAFDSPSVVTSGYFVDTAPRLAGYARAARKTTDGWAADLWRRPE